MSGRTRSKRRKTTAFRALDDLDIRIREIIRRHIDLGMSGHHRSPRKRRPSSFARAFPGIWARQCPAALRCAGEIFGLISITPSAEPGQTVLGYMEVVARSLHDRKVREFAARTGTEPVFEDPDIFRSIVYTGILIALWKFDIRQRRTSFITYLHQAVRIVSSDLIRKNIRAIRLQARCVPLVTSPDPDDPDEAVIEEERLSVRAANARGDGRIVSVLSPFIPSSW